MDIIINTAPIILEVRQKSHLNVQDIDNPEARDNARAGLEKIDEIHHCVHDGFAQLQRRCARFLRRTVVPAYDNQEVMPESYTFSLVLAERRGANKAEPLTAAMHAFVVQYALSKFYSTVSQSEQSNKYSLQAVDTGNQIDELLYTKLPPRTC